MCTDCCKAASIACWAHPLSREQDNVAEGAVNDSNVGSWYLFCTAWFTGSFFGEGYRLSWRPPLFARGHYSYMFATDCLGLEHAVQNVGYASKPGFLLSCCLSRWLIMFCFLWSCSSIDVVCFFLPAWSYERGCSGQTGVNPGMVSGWHSATCPLFHIHIRSVVGLLRLLGNPSIWLSDSGQCGWSMVQLSAESVWYV